MSQVQVLRPVLAAGIALDLVALTSQPAPGALPAELQQLADGQVALPLDDLPRANGAVLLEEFYASALEVCRQRGALLALPVMAIPMLLAFDGRRLARAGVAAPDATWGWTELLDAARRLTPGAAGGAPDQFGLAPYPTAASLLALIWQNDGELIDADKQQVRLGHARTREAIEFFAAFYGSRPASPPVAFTRQVWGEHGVRVGDRWWAAMTQSPEPSVLGSSAAGGFPPPTPTTTERLQRTGLGWADGLRGAIGSQLELRSPMGFAPLPSGRRRASALAVTAALVRSRTSRMPDVALTAFGLLADRVSRAVVPSARRLPIETMRRLAPNYTATQIQLLADALAESRVLVAHDQQRTTQLHAALRDSLMTPIVNGVRSLDETIDAAERAMRAILDRT